MKITMNYFSRSIKIVCLILLMTASILQAQENQKYRYTDKHRFKKANPSGPDLEFIFLPLPATNDYQVISNINTHGGEIFISNPGSVEKYVRYTVSKEMQPALDGWYEVMLEFDYEPKQTEYSNAIIGKIYPYDTTTYLYKRYTSNYYEFIDTDNLTMKKASDKLWANSSNEYDYAKKCFDYVHATFEFKNMGTGWLSISQLISNGGGDCGNLSSLFITLLRCKKVPARHVTLPGHAWAEFYLEGYGWIPVDPTFGYFGKASSDYGIIYSSEIVYYLKTSKMDSLFFKALGQIEHNFYPGGHKPYQCDRIISHVKIN